MLLLFVKCPIPNTLSAFAYTRVCPDLFFAGVLYSYEVILLAVLTFPSLFLSLLKKFP